MSRDVNEKFHKWSCDCGECAAFNLHRQMKEADDITEDDITQLRLAVDASDSHDRAECWKEIAVKLAGALRASGWTPASRGSEALEEFNCLLRIEDRLKDKGRL